MNPTLAPPFSFNIRSSPRYPVPSFSSDPSPSSPSSSSLLLPSHSSLSIEEGEEERETGRKKRRRRRQRREGKKKGERETKEEVDEEKRGKGSGAGEDLQLVRVVLETRNLDGVHPFPGSDLQDDLPSQVVIFREIARHQLPMIETGLRECIPRCCLP